MKKAGATTRTDPNRIDKHIMQIETECHLVEVGHVAREAIGFTQSGDLAHFDCRQTRRVTLKESVELYGRFKTTAVGFRQRHTWAFQKWLEIIALATPRAKSAGLLKVNAPVHSHPWTPNPGFFHFWRLMSRSPTQSGQSLR
jgi:hypothetical protein